MIRQKSSQKILKWESYLLFLSLVPKRNASLSHCIGPSRVNGSGLSQLAMRFHMNYKKWSAPAQLTLRAKWTGPRPNIFFQKFEIKKLYFFK